MNTDNPPSRIMSPSPSADGQELASTKGFLQQVANRLFRPPRRLSNYGFGFHALHEVGGRCRDTTSRSESGIRRITLAHTGR